MSRACTLAEWFINDNERLHIATSKLKDFNNYVRYCSIILDKYIHFDIIIIST